MVLVDTIGELGALWGLADVAFVGGSLDGRRGGQNMIEPAAYGAAVVFGPHVWNFKEPAARLSGEGPRCVRTGLKDARGPGTGGPHRLLADTKRRSEMGAVARAFVQQQQATERTAYGCSTICFARGGPEPQPLELTPWYASHATCLFSFGSRRPRG